MTIRRALKTALWVINYELWRLNMRLTYELYRKRKAQKEDTETWGDATNA